MDLLVPLLTVSATVISKVGSHLTSPFIDEAFHLRQCAVFCNHHFSVWDPKITTPPGLYVLGTAYAHIARLLGVANPCGYTSLRFLNFIGGVPVLLAVLALRPSANYKSAAIVSLPLLFPYNFLFYTDVWSTVLVVAAFMVVLRAPNGRGAAYGNLLGFLSLWFRQTNIVWIAFLGVVFVDRRRPRKASGLKGSLSAFVGTALADWRLLLPFVANGLGFGAFLAWNGGITFGDKENHQVSLHGVQVFYCLAFMVFFTAPVWLSPCLPREYASFCGIVPKSHKSKKTKPPASASAVRLLALLGQYGAIAYVIRHFTVVHPFLLADNRHYTFYIYRRLLSKRWSIVVLTPAYHFCTWLVAHLLLRTRKISRLSLSPVAVAAFFGAMVATLVPSPLFEPRYYILPLTLFRIFVCPADNAARRHLAEFSWYTFINVNFFIIFFTYEFSWLSEPGIQRIIW